MAVEKATSMDRAFEASEVAELVPVPRSVFDDDFFKAPAARVVEVESGDPRAAMGRHLSNATRVLYEGPTPLEPAGLPPVTALGMPQVTDQDEAVSAELDIPAFLRRGN